MKCPHCGGDTKVVDSRQREDGSVFRRRECLGCKGRFSSLENVWVRKTQKQIAEEERQRGRQKELETLIAALAKHLLEEAKAPKPTRKRKATSVEVVPPADLEDKEVELAKLIEEQAKDSDRVYSISLDKPDRYGRSQYDIREGYS